MEDPVMPELWGVLDKCAECGDRAGFRPYIAGSRDPKELRGAVECTGCKQFMGPFNERWEAMVAWNKEQRKLMAEKSKPPTKKLKRSKRTKSRTLRAGK